MEEDFSTFDEGFEDVFKGIHELAPFRLLDLPPELWLRICNFAIVRDKTIVIKTGFFPLKASTAAVRQPAITRTCTHSPDVVLSDRSEPRCDEALRAFAVTARLANAERVEVVEQGPALRI